MSQCHYCGHLVDPATAKAAADVQARVNQACSDASYLRIVARAIPVFYLLGLVPFLGMVGSGAFLLLLVAFPFMALRWWVKFGFLRTADPDYKKAKGSAVIALLIWIAMLAVWLIGQFLVRL